MILVQNGGGTKPKPYIWGVKCVFKCWLRWPFCVNLFGHSVQWNGFFSTCCCKWFFKFLLVENFREHCAHVKGFSPVWIRKCKMRSPFCLNFFWHSVHWYGFSSECCFKWFFTFSFLENIRGQCAQEKVFSPVCNFKCRFKVDIWVNVFSHWVHA